MYHVIDCQRSNRVDSEYADFDDALARAEELAEEQASDGEEVSSFENGADPRKGPGQWEAGACPTNDDAAYWPHVEWTD